MTKARIITVSIERTNGGKFRATSAEVIGLHVVADNCEEVKDLTKSMLCDLFEAQGESVAIYESEHAGDTLPAPWVVVPRGDQRAAC